MPEVLHVPHINIGKGTPLLRAVVGAVFDGVATDILGNAAIKTFIVNKNRN